MGALTDTLIVGTIFSLPLAFIWLRAGLEVAIGFHFWLDFVRWVAAYALNAGLWLS